MQENNRLQYCLSIWYAPNISYAGWFKRSDNFSSKIELVEAIQTIFKNIRGSKIPKKILEKYNFPLANHLPFKKYFVDCRFLKIYIISKNRTIINNYKLKDNRYILTKI